LITFTPIGLALKVLLENRFPFSRSDPRAAPDGIIMLSGAARDGIAGVSKLGHDYSKTLYVLWV
jgi:hypothetical protein